MAFLFVVQTRLAELDESENKGDGKKNDSDKGEADDTNKEDDDKENPEKCEIVNETDISLQEQGKADEKLPNGTNLPPGSNNSTITSKKSLADNSLNDSAVDSEAQSTVNSIDSVSLGDLIKPDRVVYKSNVVEDDEDKEKTVNTTEQVLKKKGRFLVTEASPNEVEEDKDKKSVTGTDDTTADDVEDDGAEKTRDTEKKEEIQVGRFTVSDFDDKQEQEPDKKTQGTSKRSNSLQSSESLNPSDTTFSKSNPGSSVAPSKSATDAAKPGSLHTSKSAPSFDKRLSVPKLADKAQSSEVLGRTLEKPDKASVDEKDATTEKDESNTKTVDEEHHSGEMTPLIEKLPLHKKVSDLLEDMSVENVDTETIGHGKYQKFSFVLEDSRMCEKVLVRLTTIGVGVTAGSSVSIFPSSIHKSHKPEDTSMSENDKETSPDKRKDSVKVNDFMMSIKSRLVVAQVVETVRANAQFSFDYLLLLILASLIACLGLVENSSVVLVASMLISPLMGPILAATFGQQISNFPLRNLGLKSELKGLLLCVVVGFLVGLIAGGVCLHGAVLGSSDQWPTAEMSARGMKRSLVVGVLIALPSGAGVALSVLGGNAGSLVGVAISASLLPPACNAGMLWAYSLLAAFMPPAVEDMIPDLQSLSTTLAPVLTNITTTTMNTTTIANGTATTMSPVTVLEPPNCRPLVNNAYSPIYYCNIAQDAALLGLISLLLTILNIICIYFMGVLVLRIKEVAPETAVVERSGVDKFFKEDVHVARNYYNTTKGKNATTIGKQFLEEWKKIKEAEKVSSDHNAEDNSDKEDESSLDEPISTIGLVNYIADVENSPETQKLLSHLPVLRTPNVAAGLKPEYTQAARKVNTRLSMIPEVYLNEKKPSKRLEQVYQTIHGGTGHQNDMRHLLLKAQQRASTHFDSLMLAGLNTPRMTHSDTGRTPELGLPDSSLHHRRKSKQRGVRFGEEAGIDENEELV